MSEAIYIETSILGYLTARSTKNLILAANMEITKDWWELRRGFHYLHIGRCFSRSSSRGS